MPSKEHNNNFPVTKTKEMETCNLTNKEFKIVVFRKLSELKKTQKDSSTKSEKQYTVIMRSLIERNYKKETSRNSRAELN